MSRLLVVLGLSLCWVSVSSAKTIAPVDVPDFPQTHLLGVKLNGKFFVKDTDQEGDYLIDIIEADGEYHVAVSDLAEVIGIEPVHTQAGYEFDTPIGVAYLRTDSIRIFEDKDYVSLPALKALGIHAQYSQSELAILLNMGYKPKKAKPTPTRVAITHRPHRFGLMNAYADFDVSERHGKDTKGSQLATNMGAFGYGLGGVWGVDLRHYANADDTVQSIRLTQNPHLDNLYWTHSSARSAVRVGVNQSSADLRQGGQYSGVTVAYSSQNIDRHLSAVGSHTKSLLQGQYSDLQTIKGVAEAGGMAELRLAGRPIARVLVGLDGRYEFLNLDVSRLDAQSALLEVAIYEYPQAPQPIKIEQILIAKRKSRVATGEYLIEAGLGRAGNIFDDTLQDNNAKHRLISDVYGEYGLSNRVAIKAGLGVAHDDTNRAQHNHYLGMNFTPAKYTNVDIGYWRLPTQTSFLGDVRYERKKLSASYTLEQHSHKDMPTQRAHSLYAYYRAHDKLSLNLSHRALYAKDSQHQTQFNLDTTLTPQLTAGAYWYSTDNRYGYRAQWQDTSGINKVGIYGDKDSRQLSLWHKASNHTTLGLSVAHQGGAPLLYQGFINHQSDDKHAFNVGYSAHRGKFGFQGSWQYRPRQGVSLSMGYHHRYVSGLGSGEALWRDLWQDKHYFYAKVRFDFYKTHQKPLRIGSYPNPQNGSVLVNLSHPDGLQLEGDGLRFNLMSINSNTPYQRTLTANLIGKNPTSSQYLLTNLPKGDYELTMDARNLPFEYSTTSLPKPTLTVAKYAPTVVSFELQKTYGMTGRLEGAPTVRQVQIWQGQQKFADTTSDEAGEFQVFELPSGTYEVRAEGYAPLTVVISDEVLMNVVLQPKD